MKNWPNFAKMQILMFWLDGQHANIALHLLMQYKPHPWNHPWDLAPDRWKICPKISKSKFDYPVFRQKSKFWHSDKTGRIPGPFCICLQRISSYKLAIFEICFQAWPHPTNLPRFLTKIWPNFAKIQNVEFFFKWAPSQYYCPTSCAKSTDFVQPLLRYCSGRTDTRTDGRTHGQKQFYDSPYWISSNGE